jgi:CoB--CoM heterodisulfide reductase subunit B
MTKKKKTSKRNSTKTMNISTLKNYSFYTGCLIPSRYPSIEISSRKVLADLGVTLHELEGTTCCPNQMAIKSTDETVWELMAARNMAIAEKNGFDILSLCNGCYNTLKTVNSTMKNNDKRRDWVNSELKEQDLEFNGTIKVKHILEVLTSELGLVAIEKKLKRNLDGLSAATHTGCHVTRPEDNISFDDTKEPKALDSLTKLLGIKSVKYPEKHICCGGGLKIGCIEDAAAYARKKILHMIENGADCIVVCCPYCRAQFESALKEIKENYNEKYELPVFYITELIALAMGYSPNELGLLILEASPLAKKELINKILDEKIELKIEDEIFDETVTRDQLKICIDCLACADDCSTAMISDYHPDELVKLALAGDLDEILKRDDIWHCMNCHECIDNCPQGFGMVKLIFRLKNLAIERGICPDVIINRDTELSKTGYSFKPNDEVRKKLGLPPIKCIDTDDISCMVCGTGVEKAKECKEIKESK